MINGREVLEIDFVDDRHKVNLIKDPVFTKKKKSKDKNCMIV